MLSLTTLLKTATDPQCSVDLIQHRCLRKRLNTNNCSRCLDVCSPGALSLHGRQIAIDKESCTECMACVSVCPQDAMTSKFDSTAFLVDLSKRSNPLVTCEPQYHIYPDELAIPCMGLISKQLLVAMALNSCREIHFDLSGCSGCFNNHAAELFRDIFKEVISVMTDIVATHMHISESPPETVDPQSERRRYLFDLKNTFSKATRSHLKFDKKSPTTPPRQSRRIPEKVKLMQKLIKGLDDDIQLRILSLLGHTLEINDDCNCCPLCKGICPTGAITIVRAEQDKYLKFDTLFCSGCGLCVEFCKKDSLRLKHFTASKL